MKDTSEEYCNMDKTNIGKSAAGQQSNFTRTGPAAGIDEIKEKAMLMAIDRCRHSVDGDLFVLASSIEGFLRGDIVLSKKIPVDLLMRAEAFISPMVAIEFSERNFTAALTLIGDMASYLRGE